MKRIPLLYRKELLDLLRDRRTVFTMMVLPMLTMPLSMMVTNSLISKSRKDAETQRHRVAIGGSQFAPAIAGSLRAAGFEVVEDADPRAAAEARKADVGIAVPARGAVKLSLYADQSDGIKWQVLRSRIRDVVERVRFEEVSAELRRAGLSPDLARSYSLESVNIAKPQKMAGSFFGGLMSFILVIFLMNGAMYAAVDMTAGEKERRTMEILLSSAATRTEIVLGKVAMAATLSFLTGVLSVISMVISFMQIRRSGGEMSQILSFPSDPGTLALAAISILPVALFAAAVAVALATPARSSREGMSYLTPVMFVMMIVGSSAFIPSLADSPLLSLVPVANFTQTIKQLFRGEWSWTNFAATLAANFVFAAAAVALAVRKFNDERMLLRV